MPFVNLIRQAFGDDKLAESISDKDLLILAMAPIDPLPDIDEFFEGNMMRRLDSDIDWEQWSIIGKLVAGSLDVSLALVGLAGISGQVIEVVGKSLRRNSCQVHRAGRLSKRLLRY
mmetsp:Transcript_23434/g.50774  ORF Transcript_23434/g.50774 Transcript_23434/m.50774 type:complete len:116 (-) Transcript_23434:736-1083(-)